MPSSWPDVVALLDRWQALAAGVLGFAAAIIAVVIALRGERRRERRELRAIRSSLGVEIRNYAANAYKAYIECKQLAQIVATPITSRMIENGVRFPGPVVYPAIAGRIGLLRAQAQPIVLFYAQIEVIRGGVGRLLRHRTPDDIPSRDVASMADSLLEACTTAAGIVAVLKTGNRLDDVHDPVMINTVNREAKEWRAMRGKLLKLSPER
jgi:hypothetical protein